MFYGIDILQHNKFYEEKFKNDVSQKTEINTGLSNF